MKSKITPFFIALLLMTSLSACTPSDPGKPMISSISLTEQSDENPIADMETNYGNIRLEIFEKEVPEMAKNFIELAKTGKYDKTPFHRIVPGFVIQGGDITNQDGTGGHSYKGEGTVLEGEYNLSVSGNLRGTLSYANRGPNTNGSQFFINLVDNTGLDHDKEPLTSQHPVFGKVIKGMDVVDAIAGYKEK